ncbi:hypothetical protein HDU93_007835 [Gonapodya sp. JEL0774]|nr:hypothetical protein HDU93_007835 [Gonapodya sp. JEL0774]
MSQPSLFVAVGDGYTGYYAVRERNEFGAASLNKILIPFADPSYYFTSTPHADQVEEAVRTQAFPRVVVAIIASEASRDLEALNRDIVEAKRVEVKNASSLAEAARGATVAYLIPPARGDKLECSRAMIEGVKTAGVENVLLLSTAGADEGEGKHIREFGQIEAIARESGIPNLCIIRSGFYMQNLLLYADQITNDYHTSKLRESYIGAPIGEGRMAPVDIQDMSLAAIKVCQQLPAGNHRGQTYTLTGPEVVSGPQITEAATRGMGIPGGIHFQDIPRERAKEILEAKPGLDEAGM